MRVILLALLLAGCGGMRSTVDFPQLPDLSAKTRQPCPPIPALTGELADLVAKDAALAVEYARCQNRHATAVEAYAAAQRLLREAAKKADAASKEKPNAL